MAYLLIRFEKPIAVSIVLERLSCLAFVEVLGDYYEDGLQNARRIASPLGLSQSCAALRSMEEAKQRCGPAEKVQIRLSSMQCLTGSLQKTGLLVSNESVTVDAISQDQNVQGLVTEISKIDEHCTIEVG